MRRGYAKTRVIFFNAPSAAHWGRASASRRHFHLILCVLAVLTVITFCMATYVFNRHYSRRESPRWTTGERLRLSSVQSGDGLKVTWYSALNTRARLMKAITASGKYPLMFEADVSDISTYHNSTKLAIKDALMMSLTRDVKGDITLAEWLDTVIEAKSGGIKLNFMTAASLERAVQLLASRHSDLLHLPVWLAVNVINGPGDDVNLLDAKWVAQLVNSTYPHAQLVFGWSAASNCAEDSSKFGRGSMETMLKISQQTQQPIIVSAYAAHAALQWRHFRWLLESSDKLSLLLWSPEEDKCWQDDSSYYDLLTIRNDWSKRRVFYDLPEARLQRFRQLAETAGSPLHYFDLHDRDASQVTWAHAVNSEIALAQAHREGAMMLEGDVILDGLGTSRQTNIPIMSHRGVHRHKNVTTSLRQWLDLVLTTNKAIKLDIKSSEAVVPTLKTLQEMQTQLQRPVWLNGDILRGPNALHDPMNTTHFLKSVNAIFPEVSLSLGWTSGWSDGQDNEAYTWEMVEKMEKVARKLFQPITFAARAVLAKRSWEKLEWLLRQSRSYTLTLWSSASDRIATSDLDFIRHQAERSRVYFDVPPNVKPSL